MRILFFIIPFFLFIQTSFAEIISITQIEAARDRGFDYLDIYTSGNIKPKGLLLEDQLILEFKNSKYSGEKNIPLYKSKRIKGISTIQMGQDLQVIVELKQGIDYEIVNVFGRNKSVIEICDRSGDSEQKIIAWEKENLKTTGEAIKAQKIKPPKGANLPLKGKTIVIDPGHGGVDPGAISINGVKEKVLTLKTSRYLADLLKLNGATVYLTRNSDRSTNLNDMLKFVNSTRADLFISVHYNTGDKEDYCGTETYYFTKKSQKIARLIHTSLIQGINRRDRGLRRADFFVLKNAVMPSILVEPVYITNKEEEKLAASADFQKEIALDIVKGVRAYFRSSKS